MKKTLIILFGAIVMLTIIISFWKAQNRLEITPYAEINNLSGVSISAISDTVSPTGLTIKFENTSDETYLYGSPYCLEVKIDGNWYKQPIVIKDDIAWNMEAYELRKEHSNECSVNWQWLYGKLKPGQYRIIKQIDSNEEYYERDIYFLAAEFRL